jgi:hypothetical protein
MNYKNDNFISFLLFNAKGMISLGGTCAVAYHLKGQRIRGPFDWVKISIKQLNSVLDARFADYSSLTIKKFSTKHPLIGDGGDGDGGGGGGSDDGGSHQPEDGSFILVNSYKVQFAHQVLKESDIASYTVKLEEIIRCFLGERDRERDSLTFVRFETGKLSSDYEKELEKLLKSLRYLNHGCKLILIIHKDERGKLSAFEDVQHVIIKVYKRYEEDWRYPSIDWGQCC